MIDNKQKKKVLSYRWVIFSILALAYFLVFFTEQQVGLFPMKSRHSLEWILLRFLC